MRAYAVIGGLAVGTLAGCFLIYHPGDYTPSTGGGAPDGGGTGASGLGGGVSTGGAGGGPKDAGGTICQPGVQCVHEPAWVGWYPDTDAPGSDAGQPRAILDLAMDLDGGVGIAGFYQGHLKIGPGGKEPTCVGCDFTRPHGFVARLDRGDGGVHTLIGVPPDGGSSRVTGLAFGPTNLPAAAATLLATTGDLLVWLNDPIPKLAMVQNAGGDDRSGVIAIKTDGGAVVAGVLGPDTKLADEAYANVDIPRVAGGTGEALLVIGFDQAVAYKWHRYYEGTGSARIKATGATDDGRGHVVVVGSYRGNFGSALPEPLGQDGFVLSFDADGKETHTTFASSTSSTIVGLNGVSVTQSAIYVAGAIKGTADVGGDSISSAPDGEDALLIRLALDGELPSARKWAARFSGGTAPTGPPSSRRALSVASRTASNGEDEVFLSGATTTSMSTEPNGGDGTLCSDSVTNGGLFWMKLGVQSSSDHPTPVWGECFGVGQVNLGVQDPYLADTLRVALFGSDVVLAGTRTGPISFGKHAFEAATPTAFVARYVNP